MCLSWAQSLPLWRGDNHPFYGGITSYVYWCIRISTKLLKVAGREAGP
jgi:hypothetical protein